MGGPLYRAAAVFLLTAGLAACGSGAVEQSACDLLGRDVVSREVTAAGGRAETLRRERSESLDQSICGFSGPGTNVRLNVDSAPEVRRRYFNRVTEALQFSATTPRRRPRAVAGLGDDDALGPAGAYWIPAYRQLFVLRGERQFVYQFALRGAGAGAERRAAVRLAAATLPGERVERRAAGGTGTAAARPELTVAAPQPGEVVRSQTVVVRGTVSGAGGAVRVNGRRAIVVAGTFARAVPLRRGRNRLRVVASTRSGPPIARTVTVRRGRSPAALGAAFARRRPGRMPDLLAQALPDARALLRAAGIRYRVIRLADTRAPDRQWAVCLTTPAPGARLQRGERVLLKVDAVNLFRTSGTACAQE